MKRRLPSPQEWWADFKQGYGEANYLLAAVQLGLIVYTAAVVSLSGLSKYVVLAIVIVAGLITVEIINRFGHWNWGNKRTLYRMMVTKEYMNHPYYQDLTRFLLTNDPSYMKKWLNPDHEDDEHEETERFRT